MPRAPRQTTDQSRAGLSSPQHDHPDPGSPGENRLEVGNRDDNRESSRERQGQKDSRSNDRTATVPTTDNTRSEGTSSDQTRADDSRSNQTSAVETRADVSRGNGSSGKEGTAKSGSRAEKRKAAADAGSSADTTAAVDQQGSDVAEIAAGLSFRQAQTALELCLARLQDSELDVESMAELYERALAYSRRCEMVLQQVEQDVMQWDPERPDVAPEPFAT